MSSKHLQKPPLVEALLEVKWKLQSAQPGVEPDPHYKFLLGRLFERLQNQYPEHEPLPASMFPEPLLVGTIQHRFRSAKGEWPLVQVGPGILTINETEKYSWSDFQMNAQNVFSKLFEAHPKSAELKITSLVLRYINAIEFDYAEKNIIKFLTEQLRTSISFPSNLFQVGSVTSNPSSLDCQTTFSSQNPAGVVIIRLATGHKNKVPALIWEIIFQTLQDDLPELPGSFAAWMTSAHQIIEDFFFKLISEELERRFLYNEQH